MSVTISPSLKKTAEKLTKDGMLLNVKTREERPMEEPQYVPTAEDIAKAEEGQILNTDTAAPKPESPLAAAIKTQVSKIVQEEIGKVDIAGMVQQAIKDAFK